MSIYYFIDFKKEVAIFLVPGFIDFSATTHKRTSTIERTTHKR
jgi:hypothetical protein